MTQKADITVTVTCRGVGVWRAEISGRVCDELDQLSENSGEPVEDILCIAALTLIDYAGNAPKALRRMKSIYEARTE